MIRLIQWLCPLRHCIAAIVYDTDKLNHYGAVDQLKAFTDTAGVLELCALCGSMQLFYEDKQTKFSTMEEAEPYMAADHAENLRIRAARQGIESCN